MSVTIELTHLKIFVKNEEITPANIFEMIWKLGLATTFPNVYIELRIFLTLPVTNCEGERLFSTLSRVKNMLRSGLKQEKLCALSMFSIGTELVDSISFDDIIETFASRKARNV